MAAEAKLEKFLRKHAEDRGVLYIKQQGRGLPDRLLVGTEGRVAFMELKAPGGRPGPLQERKVADLRRRGFKAEFINNRLDGVALIETLIGD